MSSYKYDNSKGEKKSNSSFSSSQKLFDQEEEIKFIEQGDLITNSSKSNNQYENQQSKGLFQLKADSSSLIINYYQAVRSASFNSSYGQLFDQKPKIKGFQILNLDLRHLLNSEIDDQKYYLSEISSHLNNELGIKLNKEKVLGKGSFNTAYDAGDYSVLVPQSPYPIPEIYSYLKENINIANHFQTETISYLKQEYTVVVMEKFQRDLLKDIRERVNTNSWYSQEQVISFIFTFFLTLNELKSKNICHKDIKASNFLIKDLIIKLSDFATSIKNKSFQYIVDIYYGYTTQYTLIGYVGKNIDGYNLDFFSTCILIELTLLYNLEDYFKNKLKHQDLLEQLVQQLHQMENNQQCSCFQTINRFLNWLEENHNQYSQTKEIALCGTISTALYQKYFKDQKISDKKECSKALTILLLEFINKGNIIVIKNYLSQLQEIMSKMKYNDRSQNLIEYQIIQKSYCKQLILIQEYLNQRESNDQQCLNDKYQQISNLYFKLKNPKKALNFIKKAIRNNNYFKLEINILIENNEIEKASNLIDNIVSTESNHQQIELKKLIRDLIYERSRNYDEMKYFLESVSQKDKHLFDNAFIHFQFSQYEQSIILFQKLIFRQYEKYDFSLKILSCYEWIGKALFKLNKNELAIVYFQNALNTLQSLRKSFNQFTSILEMLKQQKQQYVQNNIFQDQVIDLSNNRFLKSQEFFNNEQIELTLRINYSLLIQTYLEKDPQRVESILNVAQCYILEKNYLDAYILLFQILIDVEQSNYANNYLLILFNYLGFCLIQLSWDQHYIERGQQLLIKSFNQEFNSQSIQSEIHFIIANFYSNQKDFQFSLYSINNALNILNTIEVKPLFLFNSFQELQKKIQLKENQIAIDKNKLRGEEDICSDSTWQNSTDSTTFSITAQQINYNNHTELNNIDIQIQPISYNRNGISNVYKKIKKDNQN